MAHREMGVPGRNRSFEKRNGRQEIKDTRPLPHLMKQKCHFMPAGEGFSGHQWTNNST
jgi:hypothetical protein